MRGSPRSWLAFTAVAALSGAIAGCARRHDTATRGPLAWSGEGSIAAIDVRRLGSRPHLALITRSGDPRPALGLAVRSSGGSTTATIANAALVALLQARLEARGLETFAASDGASFRLAIELEHSGELERVVQDLARAMATPVAASDNLARVTQALVPLSAARVPAAVHAVAACDGRRALGPREALPDLTTKLGTAELERWRATTMVANAVAVGVVGPEPVMRAALLQLEGTEFELGSAGPPAPTMMESHSVAAEGAMPEGTARLELGWRVGDPSRAASAVDALGRAPWAMRTKLAGLEVPFRVVSLDATALGDGGCVRVTAEPASNAPRPAARLVESAALAAAVVSSEVELELAAPADASIVPALVARSSDARQGALLAAWWALAGASEPSRPRAFTSALLVGAGGRDAAPSDEAALTRDYGAAVPRALTLRSQALETRASVEAGQGRFWILAGNRCALATESEWERGRATMAMLSAVELGHVGDVALEAWIDPSGIGVFAHADAIVGDADGTLVAQRVARAAAAALHGAYLDEAALARARVRLADTFDAHSLASAVLLSEHLVPNHPSWIVPLGAAADTFTLSHADAQRSLRSVARGPLRIAVLANRTGAQADVATREFSRWQNPTDVGSRGCDGSAAPEPPEGGTYHRRASGPESRILVGARMEPTHAEVPQLLAAALNGTDGLLASALGGVALSANAAALGGDRAPALVIDVSVPAERQGDARAAITELLARLRRDGLDAGTLTRAHEKLAHDELVSRRDPRTRLIALFRGAPTSPADPAAVAAGLSASLPSSRLVFVFAGP